MSLQKDKRVVKPRKWSERYARWFSTRVLSTSPMFRYIVMFGFALLWSIIYLVLFGLMVNIAILLAISTALGFIVYVAYLSFLKNRFELSIPDQLFSQLVNSAIDRTRIGRTVPVWLKLDEEPYITSSYNSVFEAVIVSSKMMELMLAMPESGEAVLAYHFLRMPKRKSVMDLVAGVFVFSGTTTFVTLILAYLLALFSSSIYFLLIFASSFWMVLGSPIFLILILRGVFWTHESAFEQTEKIYKIHPQVAKDEVLSAQKMDEELANSTIWSVKSWEDGKRSGRRSSIAVSLTIILYVIIFIAVILNPLLILYLPLEFYFFIFLLPLAAGIVVFFAIKRWDRKCTDEVYYSVTGAHEQIWFD